MALTKKLSIRVNGKKATFSDKVFIYLGDGVIKLVIEILENNTNMAVETGSVFAKICVLTATYETVYSERCPIVDGEIDFSVTKEFIKKIAEEGTHLLQIHLYDSYDEVTSNRYTIPPVTLTLLKPICDIGSDSSTPRCEDRQCFN